jgi:hypothetical protein
MFQKNFLKNLESMFGFYVFGLVWYFYGKVGLVIPGDLSVNNPRF